MTNFIFSIYIFLFKIFNTEEIKANAENASYRLVKVNKKTQTCENFYFFTLKELVNYAQPPNIWYGDGNDYYVYHKNDGNRQTYLKLNNSKKILNGSYTLRNTQFG